MPIYLSNVIDTNEFRRGYFNSIVAPCGSGKSSAAINKIAPIASIPSKALYLIDTTNGCRRIANEKNMALPCLFYGDDVANGGFDCEFDKSKVVVATYAKFGVWCSLYRNFADNFEVIVCDEAHNIVQFANFGEKGNFAAIARDSICNAVKRGRTLFTGITATPEYLQKLYCPKYDVPIDTTNLVHYIEKQRIPYASINQLLRQQPIGQHGVIYVSRVQQMEEFATIARAYGHNPICLWSLQYKQPMNEEQLNAREHLLEFEAIPPQYDLLIINASCETAINIRSHIDFFIVHNTNQTHITQARGRYRANLDTLYLLDKEKGTIYVPPEYLDRKLFKEDKDALIKELAIKNDKGRFIPWYKLSQMITDSGYTFSEGRDDDRPYIIIHRL